MKRISLIVPCLNEGVAIPAFKQEIDRVFKECLEGYAPELIFVDDGSTDRSLEMIKKMAEHSPEVKSISGRKPPSMRAWKRPQGIMPPSWMWTFRILLPCSRIC